MTDKTPETRVMELLAQRGAFDQMPPLHSVIAQAIREAEARGERRGLQRAADKLERLATFGCHIKEAEGHIRHMMIETK